MNIKNAIFIHLQYRVDVVWKKYSFLLLGFHIQTMNKEKQREDQSLLLKWQKNKKPMISIVIFEL